MNNYLFVCSRKTRDIAELKGLIGFHDRIHSLDKVYANMRIGDRLFLYITKEMIVDGIAVINTKMFLDDKMLYSHIIERCVKRIGVEVQNMKKANFKPLVAQLSFIKEAHKSNWGGYLVQSVIELNDHDTSVLEKAIFP